MRVAFFTAGTLGAGHLVHGIAIGRALRRAGFTGEYRMFGPSTPFAQANRDDWQTVPIDAREVLRPDRAPTTELALALHAYRPDRLVVDMFWAPLRFILPLPGCRTWLIVRSFPGVWFQGPAGVAFDETQYHRIVGIEPGLERRFDEVIDPIVVANPDECQPKGALRARLGIPAGQRLVVATHAGKVGEIGKMGRDGPPPTAFDLHQAGALFPLAEWLGDADEIHSGAGYNSFWEAHWLGWADRTTFHAFPRPMDNQAWRTTLRGYRMRSNGADTLARMLLDG
jgi:hypothetical protein